MEVNNRYVPVEMAIEFLKRLSVKDLIQFQRSCKSGRDLIKSPDFIHEHLRHSVHQNPYLVFKGTDLYWRSLRLYKPDQSMGYDEVPIPPDFSVNSFRASYIDSSNGLLCIGFAGPTPIVILWNPLISEWRRVDFGLECKSFQKRKSFQNRVSIKMGFGFSNCKVNDCKVVFISDFTNGTQFVHQVDVYSLSTSSWKEVQSGNLLDDVAITSYGKTINGSIYFKSNGHLLVSYDIEKEEFALIPLPVSPEFNDPLRYSVEVHENKLALLSYTDNPARGSSLICLWEMEVGGQRWIVKRIERPFLTRPATIWKNEIVCQFLLVYDGAPQPERESLGIKIVLANPTTDAGNVRSFDVSKHGSGLGMLNYVPSFLPVNKTNNSPDD